jgi:hypothetical protein
MTNSHMTERTPYTYAIARYIHDPLSGEFVNIGVVAVDMATRQPYIKFRKAYSRAKAMFPELRRDTFLASVSQVERALKASARELLRSDLLSSEFTAQTLVRKALPLGEQGIQLGQVGSGAATDMSKRFDQLFERYVLVHEKKSDAGRRNDNDVWRPLRQRFEDEQVAYLFAPEVIEAATDRQKFEHTWRNGKLHCIQPLSFDLSDGDSIREKARSWLGRLTALDDAAASFKAYLVVAGPQDPRLNADFTASLALLRKVQEKVDCELVPETQADVFAGRLAAEMKAHAAQ